MTCMECSDRAEDCWDVHKDPDDDTPCTCCCHDNPKYHRASGEQVCKLCKKLYRQHPHGGPIGMDNKRFLRRLCNDELVKL